MRLLRAFIAVLGIGLVGFMLFATYPAWSSLFASAPATFTPEAWRNAHPYRRQAMAADFMDRQPFIGSRRAEIEAMLGKPDYRDNDRIDYVVAITVADYMLFTIEFDSAGRAVKAYLRQN